jgi:glycosyltransferase involved in cell wall biosynthesis
MEMKMKRILFYINVLSFGGAERVIVNLANRFSNLGYEVIFVTSFKVESEYELDKRVKRINLEEKEINESFIMRNINRTLKLRKVCKETNPNIAISFMAEPNFRTIMATRFLKIKTLISVRNDPEREYPSFKHKLLAKTLYQLADGCVFQTEDAKSWFPNRVKNKSRVILNHVENKFYQVDSKDKRENIVAVGRLEEQKNHSLLIIYV